MNVIVYSTTTCATCHLVTGWLDKQNISYQKKNTDEDATALADFMEVNDGMIGVPFTVIVDDTGYTTKIMGFDQGKFKQALSI